MAADPRELEEKLWSAIKSDRTLMVGLEGVDDGHARPMTAQIDEERGPLWFFTARDNGLVRHLTEGSETFATFASKGHDLFATLQGRLSIDNDPAVIDRLWNRFIAAWYEGGKSDPKLVLLRFEPTHAEVWLDASSIVAGIKMLLGVDPKKDYADKVGEIDMRR